MTNNIQKTIRDGKELAILYDLYIVPGWREAFDCIVDDEVKLPKEGKFLDAGCGTGGYAIDLAVRGGEKVEVVGVDFSPERLTLARGKAEIKKIKNVTFQQGSLTALGLPDDEFDLVIGDASMPPVNQIGQAFVELTRVAKKGATVKLKLTTRGSFDELFSIYWEALYNLELIQYTPELEGLITERLTVTAAEQLAADAGLTQVKSVTRKERFDYSDARTFFDAPLIETFFLDEWLSMLSDQETRQDAQKEMARIIDRERHMMDFDISIKATLISGQK
ncbi:MAG: class I SAM-dependent methyltransferase [Acidobacteria bacterium]|nr:class I SAM-dependent methyltransferase [Acidobacteriota bacterium]